MLFICCLLPLVILSASFQNVGSSCVRNEEFISDYANAVQKINEYFDHNITYSLGGLLHDVALIIWPPERTKTDWYCIDPLVNGRCSPEASRNATGTLEGFREQVQAILIMASQQPPNRGLGRALQELHVNVSFHYHSFLKVLDIEAGSLYIREFSLLLMASNAEYVNYCKTSCSATDLERWRRRSLAPTSFIMAKYSYWFLKYMPKKMADYLIFNTQTSRNTKLHIVNQLDDKMLREYIEPSSHIDLETTEGKTYAFGLLKAARLTMRRKIHKYWKTRLDIFRDRLFRHYCENPACQNDFYEEFAVKAAQPVALQYLSTTGNHGGLCSNDLCSTMWLSTAGNKDYIYYRSCPEANPLESHTIAACQTDSWKICGGWGGCKERNEPLINNQFPVMLRSNTSELCIDCSDTSTWCRQAACAVASLHPGYPSSPPGDVDNCFAGLKGCAGPRFQIHGLDKRDRQPLEILDEVYFSYGGRKGKSMRFLRGEIYTSTGLKTQHYMRVTQKDEFNNKTEETHGHLFCSWDRGWDAMSVAQQVACSVSSYTLFRPVDVDRVIYGHTN